MDQITTYATLQSGVLGMLVREDDAELSAALPVLIQMLEADLNDRLLLRDMESEETITCVVGQNYVALPTGFVSPLALWLIVSDARQEIVPVLPQQLPYHTSNSQPHQYAIDGSNIRFDCPADQAYSGRFRMVKKSNLSDATTSNALLLKRPDVYLYGTLYQACLHLEDDAATQKWRTFYENSCASLKAAENRSRSVPARTEFPLSNRSTIFQG